MVVWGGSSLDVVPPDEAGGGDGYSFDPTTGTTVRIREVQFADGAAYSPTRDAWRKLAPTDVSISSHQAQAVWTGSEMLLLGVNEQGDIAATAYSPKGDRWRPIAPPPNELKGIAPSVVWTGTEAIVWGGVAGGGAGVLPLGAAYRPASDQWRLLPAPPLGNREGHSAVWTGAEMIVWSGTDHVGPIGQGEEAEGAAFHPATNTWRRLPPAPIDGRYSHTAIWTGSEMITWGGGSMAAVNDGAAYNPAADTWRPLASSPLEGREWHTWLEADGTAYAWGGYNFYAGESVYDDGARYDPHNDRWEPLPQAPIAKRCQQSAVWTGDAIILWGGTAHCGTHGPRDADGAALRTAN
jgi:hypothetical protein